MKKVLIELCEINIMFMTPFGSVVFIAQAVGCLHSWQPTVGKINNKVVTYFTYATISRTLNNINMSMVQIVKLTTHAIALSYLLSTYTDI